MGRGRVFGAVSAGTALVFACAATAAGAVAPSWHHCAKATPKKTGNYSDKNCSVVGPPGKSRYEEMAGVGKKSLKAKSTGSVVLVVTIPGKGKTRIVCAKASISGHPVAPGGVDVKMGLSQCEAGSRTCESVETEPLSGNLGWLDASTGVAGLSLTSEKAPGSGLIAEIICEEGLKFDVTGSVIVSIGPSGGLSNAHTLDFALGEYGSGTLTNPPAFEEAYVGTLRTEYADEEVEEEEESEFMPEGGIPSGLEGSFALSGEALGIS